MIFSCKVSSPSLVLGEGIASSFQEHLLFISLFGFDPPSESVLHLHLYSPVSSSRLERFKLVSFMAIISEPFFSTFYLLIAHLSLERLLGEN